MNIVTDINTWREIRRELTGKTIGFVPTMGHLHAGHLSLCAQSQTENDITVISIFVNPAQFNQSQDFDLYPRTLTEDQRLLSEQGVDFLLLPSSETLYPDNYEIQVTETNVSTELEGEYRPGHFNGVLTVVMKLLNLVQPGKAYFGKKDYQQLLLIQKMVAALFMPVEIVACETLRAEDGLALSSRNTRLNPVQRENAAHFAKWLRSDSSAEQVRQALSELGFKVDYIAEQWGRRLGAVWLDNIRLIDNVEWQEK